MQNVEQFLAEIEDQKAVHVTLPIVDSQVDQRAQCVFGVDRPPDFFLIFPPEILTADQVDPGTSCTVSVDLGGQNFSILADIKEIRDKQTLLLSAKDVENHAQQRNYFRVDAVAPVSAAPLLPKSMRSDGEERLLEGETLDISGSGALCVFNQPIDKGENVRIELALPTGNMEIVRLVGHVVRSRKVDDNTYHAGLHFTGLTSEDRDKIMGCCFELQRKHLKMKVQVSRKK